MKELVDLAEQKGYNRFHPEWFENNKIDYRTWFLELSLLQKWLRDKKILILQFIEASHLLNHIIIVL